MKIKKRVFEIIQIGNKKDLPSKLFDYFIVFLIFLNLFTTFFSTFEESKPYTDAIYIIELITCIIFAVEYALRLWTADYLYKNRSNVGARIKFIFSFYGLIDLFAFLPFFLPSIFASGIVALRIFRVVRIFRLFKINAQYDAFNIITDVLKEKKNQLFSSIVIIFILLMASSLGMYSLEHDAQPETFQNAFSGIWWSVSTLLTVGYGDIYPVTILGRILAIFIAFLGVGIVSIPTGIISAGFVEQYSKMHKLTKKQKKDVASKSSDSQIDFTTMVIEKGNQWEGKEIKTLDISRRDYIVLIRRDGDAILPKGNTIIMEGDEIVIYSENG